ncbi:MAG: hypothetical protein ISR52_02785 [Rhodospirillales bacterium]|nr:hypothetical protein [Rhodospirillales bacterium]
MTKKKTDTSKPKMQAAANSGSRKCLMCGETFDSEGSHNRVCKRCKGTQAWREGRSSTESAA